MKYALITAAALALWVAAWLFDAFYLAPMMAHYAGNLR